MIIEAVATLSSLGQELRFWKGETRRHLQEQRQRNAEREEAIGIIMEAAIRTKTYLTDLRDGVPKSREREEVIALAWQKAASAIRRFDERLYQISQVKSLGWADPREWLKRKNQAVMVKLDIIIKQCKWLRDDTT